MIRYTLMFFAVYDSFLSFVCYIFMSLNYFLLSKLCLLNQALDILHKYIDDGICQAPAATEQLYREAVPACVQYSIELNEL